MNFGSFGAGFGSFGAGVGGLLPSFTNITSWLKAPTADGKTLANSKGTDANLTGVNCLDFDGTNDFVSFSVGGFNTSAFTVSFVYEAPSTLVNDDDILSQSAGSGTGRGWLRVMANGSIKTFLHGKGGALVADAGSISADTKYELSFAYNGSNSIQLTINGVAESALSVSSEDSEATGDLNLMKGHTSGTTTCAAGKVSNFKVVVGLDTLVHAPLAEGSGTKAYDVSGNGHHGVITTATWTTLNGVESWNHEYGFDTDILKGYEGYWDLTSSASGAWTINESNLTLTGNTGTSSRIRQVVDGLVSGDTLVVSGTIVQTGGAGSDADVAISSSSAGWSEGSVFLGGEIGTYTFSTTLNATSSTCDIQLIVLNGANVVISDLKFTVVKKIPALNTKTKQVATFDGAADEINTGYNPSGDLIIDARIKADTVTGTRTIHQCNGNAGYFFRINDGEWQLYAGNGYVFSASTGIDPATETLYDTRVEYTASSNAWVVKVKVATDSTYTTVGSGTRTPTFSSANLILGQKGGTGYFDGEFHSFKITDGGTTKAEYDFQSDIGTTTVQDLSTNNNDGTVTVGSGATATFWGTRVADTAGSLVSADYATGNTTISNPAGFVHNGSECGVAMVTNSLTSAQLFAINNATATETFVRKDNGNIVQILDYSSALTGDDLTRTRSYVG